MNARTRVLLVGLRWPAETFLMRKIEALQRSGLQVIVAAKVVSTAVPVPNGAQLLKIPLWNTTWLRRFGQIATAFGSAVIRSPRQTLATVRAATAEAHDIRDLLSWLHRLLPFAGLKVDVLHFEWNFAAAELLPLFSLMACPSVVSCRGAHVQVAPTNPLRKSLVEGMRESFQKASAVHCVSRTIEDEACKLGLNRAKSTIIRPAVDPAFFHPAEYRVETGGFRIVTNGSIIWRKGYEYALLALRRLRDHEVDAHLDIIGDGPKTEQQRVLFAIDDLGLSPFVTLCGHQTPQQVLDRLQNADVFLLSSLSEGISNAALEAMACGIPVVTTNCGGMAEAVTDGVEGFVVPVRNPAAMSERLERLAMDRRTRRRMGTAARDRVLRDFTLAGQASGFVALYSRLCDSGAISAAARATLLDVAGEH